MSIYELMYCDNDHADESVEYMSVPLVLGFTDPARTPKSWVAVRDGHSWLHYCPDCAREIDGTP